MWEPCFIPVNWTSPPRVADAPAVDGEKLTALAGGDPVTYFSLVETIFRRGAPSVITSRSLLLPQLLTGEDHPQLLLSWQHYKAYISAFASWVKNYLRELKALEAAPGGVDHLAVRRALVGVNELLDWLMMQLNARYTGARGRSMKRGGLFEQLRCLGAGSNNLPPTASSTILVLLALVSRAAAETLEVLGRLLQKLVHDTPAPWDNTLDDAASGSLPGGSRMAGSSSSSGGGGGTSASETPPWFPVADVLGTMFYTSVFQYNALLLWQEAATAGQPPASSKEALELPSSSISSGSSSSSSSCSRRLLSFNAAGITAAAAAGNAGCFLCSWIPEAQTPRTLTEAAAAAARLARPTSPRPATAPAAIVPTLGVADPSSLLASAADLPSPAAAAATAAARSAAATQLPKRLAKLPQGGLPAAVAEYMEHIKQVCLPEHLELNASLGTRSQLEMFLRVRDMHPCRHCWYWRCRCLWAAATPTAQT